MKNKLVFSFCFSYLILTCAADARNEENICGVGSPYLNAFQYEDYFKHEYAFRIYRSNDLTREKPVGVINIKQGKGTIESPQLLSLQEAEILWGPARVSVPSRGELPRIDGPDWRVFDVVGIGFVASKTYLDRRPKYFYIYGKFKNDQLVEYAVDGPNILDFSPITRISHINTKTSHKPFDNLTKARFCQR